MKWGWLRAGAVLICLFAFWEAGASLPLLAQEAEPVQTPSAKPPRIIIRDNVIADGGIGIYWTHQSREDTILIVNNLFINNGEAIRWASLNPNRIEGNELRGNLIALKVIGEYIAPGGVATPLRVSPVMLRLNNILESQEYAVLNLTDVPVIADENFWGNPSRPLASDRPKLKLQEERSRPKGPIEAAALPPLGLRLETYAASLRLLSLRVTLAGLEAQRTSATRVPDLELAIPIAMLLALQPAQEPASLPEVVKGPVELKSWLDSPVNQKEEKKEMKEEKEE